MNIDYSKIADDPRVVKLLKLRIEIEDKIKAIDETALIKHELELFSLHDVVDTEGECCESGCDWKHSHTNWWQCTVCKDIQAR